jgi:hypothetical protein
MNQIFCNLVIKKLSDNVVCVIFVALYNKELGKNMKISKIKNTSCFTHGINFFKGIFLEIFFFKVKKNKRKKHKN